MGKHLPASYVDTAIARYQRDGQLEIDDNAEVSVSPVDSGAYVQCWLWIEDEEVTNLNDE